jgi:hypothetical protein
VGVGASQHFLAVAYEQETRQSRSGSDGGEHSIAFVRQPDSTEFANGYTKGLPLGWVEISEHGGVVDDQRGIDWCLGGDLAKSSSRSPL